MFCAQCGKPVLDGAKFCNHCGAAVAAGPGELPSPMATGSDARGGTSQAGPGTGPSSPSSGRIGRIRNIVLSPATEWPVIAAEPSAPSALYLGYVAPLVAIGIVATFIGHSFVGLPLVGRSGIGEGLAHALVSYVLSFAGVFLVALIVDLLAPSFGGQRDSLAALKVTVYSFTPGWIAGIFNLIPLLGVVAIIGALYGLYLLYLGLPVLMRCPSDKSLGYTIVTVICAVVTGVVITGLTTCAVGGLGLIGIGVKSRMSAHSSPVASISRDPLQRVVRKRASSANPAPASPAVTYLGSTSIRSVKRRTLATPIE